MQNQRRDMRHIHCGFGANGAMGLRHVGVIACAMSVGAVRMETDTLLYE